MKFLAALSLFALAPALAGAVAPTRTVNIAARDGLSLNPPASVIAAHANGGAAKREVLPRSNAERLARGLPLKKPRHVSRPKRASPSEPAKRSTPSGTPVSYTGAIQVIDIDGGAIVLGYVSATLNDFGEYGVTSDPADALAISFTTTDPSSPFDISISGTFPYLGAIAGFASTSDDFFSGSYNYAYLGSVEGSPAGSPARDAPNSYSDATGLHPDTESAIWTYASSNGLFDAQWTNTDFSETEASLVYVDSDDVIILTGDVDAFNAAFGGNYHRVALRAVQIAN